MSLETYGESPSFLRFEAFALGTENALLLPSTDDSAARRAAQEAWGTIELVEQSLSKFLPQSDLSLLNRLGGEGPVHVSPQLRELLRLSHEAWELSEGAFDPTVGELLHAWGLVDLEGRIPSEDEILRLRARCGMCHVHLDAERGTVALGRGVSLDLGGIGKGHAVDRVAAGLEKWGFDRWLFSSGRSSIAAHGEPPGGGAWRFEIVHPEEPEETLCEVAAEPGVISSSGAYARRFVRGWKEYGHVLDPRTGKPAQTLRCATLWTETAVLGDVLSTVLFVLGKGALTRGGPLERIARAWALPGREPRFSVLYAEEAPECWGGLRIGTFHFGRPGFTLSSP